MCGAGHADDELKAGLESLTMVKPER